MELSPSWEAANCAATQEILSILLSITIVITVTWIVVLTVTNIQFQMTHNRMQHIKIMLEEFLF
jgi:ATP/ADP translocase